jgi:gamma-glutamylcyclotransferase (GGCT)/AIG2-like uncharacterized protein YtfP
MAFRCPDARLIGTGPIEGARLEFSLHATVERSRIKGARVPVAVWEISQADEERLDLYEGFPRYYTKKEWPVRMADGSQITGMVYLMQTIRRSPPAASYYNGILKAYVDLGLGSEIDTVLRPALKRSMHRRP